MKIAIVYQICCVLIFFISTSHADDVVFPKTKTEIVDALSFKNKRISVNGVDYISEESKIYKVIDGKRYRLRGIKIVKVAEDILPKAGALINFDFDSDEILPESHPLLAEFSKAMKDELRHALFFLVGHADSIGHSDYNKKLSYDRAQSVANHLMNNHGISLERITIKGYGETRPIASNESEVGRRMNRRVEFIRIE